MDIGAACCTSCHWWNYSGLMSNEGARLGKCQRHAPVAMSLNGKAQTRWPLSREDDRCGDHIEHDAPEGPDGR